MMININILLHGRPPGYILKPKEHPLKGEYITHKAWLNPYFVYEVTNGRIYLQNQHGTINYSTTANWAGFYVVEKL